MGHSGGHRVRKAEEPLWPHWPRGPGLQASGFRLQLQSSNSKLQTSTFNFGVQSSNSKLQVSTFNFGVQSSNFKLQVSTLEFRLQTSSFSFGLRAPGLRFRLWAPGQPEAQGSCPRSPRSPGEVPWSGSPWSPGEPGSPRGIQESSGENPLTLEPKVFPDPRGEVPSVQESPEVPGGNPQSGERRSPLGAPGSSSGRKLSGSPGRILSPGIPGVPESPGKVPWSGSPLEPRGIQESSGESFGSGAKWVPGSGGDSVSPGVPWKFQEVPRIRREFRQSGESGPDSPGESP